MGEAQFVNGYSLLLPDPVVATPNEMTEEVRKTFLYEMTVVGDALLVATNCLRINYEILGNVEPSLHAHIIPRYADEPEELRLKPVWFYNWDTAPRFDAKKQHELVQKIREYLKNAGIVQE